MIVKVENEESRNRQKSRKGTSEDTLGEKSTEILERIAGTIEKNKNLNHSILEEQIGTPI